MADVVTCRDSFGHQLTVDPDTGAVKVISSFPEDQSVESLLAPDWKDKAAAHQEHLKERRERDRAKKLGERLLEAVMLGLWGLVSDLLDDGADVNYSNRHGITPLYTACIFRYKKLVNKLLERGASLNVSDLREDLYGHLLKVCPLTMTELLNWRHQLDYRALGVAINSDCSSKVIRYLMSVDGMDLQTALVHAVLKERFAIASDLIDAGASINGGLHDVIAPLTIVAEEPVANRRMIQFMIDSGAFVEPCYGEYQEMAAPCLMCDAALSCEEPSEIQSID